MLSILAFAALAVTMCFGLLHASAFLQLPMSSPPARTSITALHGSTPSAIMWKAQSGAYSSTGSFTCAATFAAAAVATASRLRKRSKATKTGSSVVCFCKTEYGQDLSVPGDSFVVLGLAHCFEQVDGKLKDCWVLEPISASTVEVIENGAQTSYETFVGTTVADVLKQDTSVFPTELLCGNDVRFADNLEFRTGCAARTWMRDHARNVVRKMAPDGVVRTDFNTSTADKRILNFVNEVKDSDNIKQDMSIDVYGRDEEKPDESEVQIADLYNA